MHADASVAAIQTRGQLAIFGSIPFHIRVKQVQIAATHLYAPDFRPNRAMAGVHLHYDGLTVLADGRFHRQLVDVGPEVLFSLPTLTVQPLTKISLPVEQSNADQRYVQVGCTLDVIAREYAQAAGIDRQRLVESEFRREVCNRARAQNAGMSCTPGLFGFPVFTKTAIGIVDPAVEDQFCRASLQPS